jgi:hypothetical protein
MSKICLYCLAFQFLFAAVAFAAKPVTVDQLESALRKTQTQQDADVAQQLSGLELTERLSTTRLSAMEARLPGEKSRVALLALADASAFLDPPAADIPADPPPDINAQRLMISRAVNYLDTEIPKLPNFFATRTIVYFADNLKKNGRPDANGRGGKPWRTTGSSTTTVYFRDGKEDKDIGQGEEKIQSANQERLIPTGTFGPILSRVMDEVGDGQLTWRRWERGADGTRAVFRFAVPQTRSHFEVDFRSSSAWEEAEYFQQFSAYHGEIKVDPATGTILRLILDADLEPGLPVARAGLVVDYGPVEIGGKTYICPVRSVSLLVGRTLLRPGGYAGNTRSPSDFGPETALLSDITFGQYHVFRAEAHIVPY